MKKLVNRWVSGGFYFPFGALLVLAVLFLVLFGCWKLEWTQTPVTGMGHALNDQVGYLGVAKNLVFKRTLESNTILPSTLCQNTKTNTLYAPGFYLVLAASLFLFGVNFFSSILPSVLGFLITVVSSYLISLKLFNKAAAIYTSLMIIIFPFFLCFSLTSMAEMAVIGSAVLSFLIFVYLPEEKRYWIGPFISVIPVFFRETSIIVCIPMAAVIWSESKENLRWGKLFKFSLLATTLILFVLKEPLGGRPSLLKANLFGGFSEIYTDATFFNRINPSLFQWIKVCFHRFGENFWSLMGDWSLRTEQITMKFLLFASGVTFFYGIRNRNAIEFSVGLMGIVLWGAILAMYAVTGFRGLRVSLILVPFVSIIFGCWVSRRLVSKRTVLMLYLLFASVSVHKSFLKIADTFSEHRKIEMQVIDFINNDVKPDKTRIFIAPFWIVMPWLNKNYPIVWSLLPANQYTFELLNKSNKVGTILLHDSETKIMSLSLFRELGFDLTREINFLGTKFYVLNQKDISQ